MLCVYACVHVCIFFVPVCAYLSLHHTVRLLSDRVTGTIFLFEHISAVFKGGNCASNVIYL